MKTIKTKKTTKGRLEIYLDGKLLKDMAWAYLIDRSDIAGIRLADLPRNCQFEIVEPTQAGIPVTILYIQNSGKGKATLSFMDYSREYDWVESAAFSVSMMHCRADIIKRLGKKVEGLMITDYKLNNYEGDECDCVLHYDLKSSGTMLEDLVAIADEIQRTILRLYEVGESARIEAIEEEVHCLKCSSEIPESGK